MQSQKAIKHLNDLLEHKRFILISCNIMVDWLFKQGQEELAIELVRRAIVHDNSKFSKDELSYIIQLSESNDSLTNPNYIMNDNDRKCIELHWKHNRHHPEFYSNIEDMKEIDIIEMVCDWYARSLQLNTDLMEFVYTRQQNRFKFPEKMFDMIVSYCNILLKEDASRYGSKI